MKKIIKWDRPCYKCRSHFCDLSCKEALAQPEQEPVACNVSWLAQEAGLEPAYPIDHPMAKFIRAITERAEVQAKREWVGLTDDERNLIGRSHAYVDNIIRAVEVKLKEKNT